GAEERLCDLPQSGPGEPGMDACVRRDRQQAFTVPRPGVLARIESAVVERGGVDRDRRDHDRHGPHAVREEERLEEVQARASGREGTGEHHLARLASRDASYTSNGTTGELGDTGLRGRLYAAGDPNDLNRVIPAEGVG